MDRSSRGARSGAGRDRRPRPAARSRRAFLRTAGGATALVAGAAGVATGQEATRHTVEMTDDLVFDPAEITVAPGDTVVWENVGAIGHSVTAYEDGLPGGATYFASGGFETERTARSAYRAGDPASGDVPQGETYEHTFETEGLHEYFCIPHETVGMLGSVSVVPGGAAPTDGGGAPVPAVPDAARTLAVATTVALVTVLGLTYVLMKYGGDYATPGERERPR